MDAIIWILPFVIAANAAALGVWAHRAARRRGWSPSLTLVASAVVAVTAFGGMFWAWDIVWLVGRISGSRPAGRTQ